MARRAVGRLVRALGDAAWLRPTAVSSFDAPSVVAAASSFSPRSLGRSPLGPGGLPPLTRGFAAAPAAASAAEPRDEVSRAASGGETH